MTKLSVFQSNYNLFKNNIDDKNSNSLSAVLNNAYCEKHEYSYRLYRPFFKFSENVDIKNCKDVNTGLLRDDSWASLISTKLEMQNDSEYFIFLNSELVMNDDFNLNNIISNEPNIDIFFHNNSIDFDFFIFKKSPKMIGFMNNWYCLPDDNKDLGAVMQKNNIKHKVLTQSLAKKMDLDQMMMSLIKKSINFVNKSTEIMNTRYIQYDTDKLILTDKKLKVLIGTPCFGAQVSCNYTTSLMKTIELFKKYGIECQVSFVPNQIVTRARNIIAHQFLSGDFSHLFFIDADIDWKPEDALKLLKHNRDIIIGLYANKSYLVDNDMNVEGSLYKKLQYSSTFVENINSIDKNNVIEVKYGATGFMCIKRHVFDKMTPKTEFYNHSGNKMYDFFPCRVEDGEYLTEDYYFCKKWRDMKQQIFSDISINLNHEGWHSYKGCPLKTFTTMKKT